MTHDQAVSDTEALRLDNVSKLFGGKPAVRNVSIAVRRGEVFGFLGPNGAGKSTTIRMILDILRPTSGNISVLGKSSRDIAVHRQLGFLSGDMVLDVNLTGRQYLTFAAGQYAKDCGPRAAELAETLQASLDVKIGNYSRGNRQKIGLIAALQHAPELLILDEPTSGFDPLVQEQFAELIRAFRAGGGTVFMSSHILSEVQQLCDRMAFIKDGEIINTTDIDGLTAKAAKRVHVRLPAAGLVLLRRQLEALDGVRLQPPVEDYGLEFAYSGQPKALLALLARHDVQDLTIQEPDLEEIFMHYYEPGETTTTKPADSTDAADKAAA